MEGVECWVEGSDGVSECSCVRGVCVRKGVLNIPSLCHITFEMAFYLFFLYLFWFTYQLFFFILLLSGVWLLIFSPSSVS